MLISSETKTYGNTKIKVSFEINPKQDNLFTTAHIKYIAMIHNINNGISKRFAYQCNKERPPKAEDLLYCLILDSDSANNITSFEDYLFEFGYSTIEVKNLRKHKKDYKKFFKGIKKFSELFNQEDILAIRCAVGDNLLV